MAIVESTKIILKRPGDWKMWIQIKRHAAIATYIWPSVDPTLSNAAIAHLPTLIEPNPNVVKGGRKPAVPGNTIFGPLPPGVQASPALPERDYLVSDLDQDEKDTLRFL